MLKQLWVTPAPGSVSRALKGHRRTLKRVGTHNFSAQTCLHPVLTSQSHFLWLFTCWEQEAGQSRCNEKHPNCSHKLLIPISSGCHDLSSLLLTHSWFTLCHWVQKLALILKGWPFEPPWKLPKEREDKTEIQDRQPHKTASRNRCREAPVFIIDFQGQRLVVRVCLTSFRLAP